MEHRLTQSPEGESGFFIFYILFFHLFVQHPFCSTGHRLQKLLKLIIFHKKRIIQVPKDNFFLVETDTKIETVKLKKGNPFFSDTFFYR